MHDDARREAIQHAFAQAKAAREAKDAAAREASLVAAQEHAIALRDPGFLATACFRLAKARFDDGEGDVIEALAPLVASRLHERSMWGTRVDVNPFDRYEAGLRALEPLTRRHWDHRGYAARRETVDALWAHWRAAWEAREDRFLVAWGDVVAAWAHAARGEVEALRALVMRHARHRPAAFAGSRHRHAEDTDGTRSVLLVQRDLARTWLRGATWAGDAQAAWQARELLEDALADLDQPRHASPWDLEALVDALDTFEGGADEADRRMLGRLAEGLPEAHRLRMQATATGAVDGYRRSAEAALASLAGPEWAVWALRRGQVPAGEPVWGAVVGSGVVGA